MGPPSLPDMQYWLVKSEPEAYSWQQLVKDKETAWTGVRNFQARIFLREMKKGDAVLFYHSVSEKQIVGVASVCKAAYADPTAKEGHWVAINLKPRETLAQPVSLETIKKDSLLKRMRLLKQTRLSISPVTEPEYKRIMTLARGAKV